MGVMTGAMIQAAVLVSGILIVRKMFGETACLCKV